MIWVVCGCVVQAANEADAEKTNIADAGDVKDTKSEGDMKHKQRRWSDMPDAADIVPKVCCA